MYLSSVCCQGIHAHAIVTSSGLQRASCIADNPHTRFSPSLPYRACTVSIHLAVPSEHLNLCLLAPAHTYQDSHNYPYLKPSIELQTRRPGGGSHPGLWQVQICDGQERGAHGSLHTAGACLCHVQHLRALADSARAAQLSALAQPQLDRLECAQQQAMVVDVE